MRTVSVLSSQANFPLSDINRQDNKTLRAQFRIIFGNQRLISCQFAFTLSRLWRFYHHAVKESQAGTTGALISHTYCLHEMVCTYILPKWWNIFTKVTSRPPLPKMNLSLISSIGGHSKQKVNTKCHICFNVKTCLGVFVVLSGFTRIVGLVSLITFWLFMNSSLPQDCLYFSTVLQ